MTFRIPGITLTSPVCMPALSTAEFNFKIEAMETM
jgi:hypothetical protein